MPIISIVIPTCNRPDLLSRAIHSVLAQTFQDFEIIIIDDGVKERAAEVVHEFADPRIRYFKNETSLGGGGARNRGITESQGEYIAFLDDDDEWMPEKLMVQMNALTKAPPEVGFCFCAIINVFVDHEETSTVEEGTHDFSEIALVRFNGFLTSTLMMRASVLRDVGGFDPAFPSHQEPELIIRMTRQYLGIGINRPLVRMNMTPREHIGGSLERRIRGREMLLAKHQDLYRHKPQLLAKHYLQIGFWFRDAGLQKNAQTYFLKAFQLNAKPIYLIHAILVTLRMFLSGTSRSTQN